MIQNVLNLSIITKQRTYAGKYFNFYTTNQNDFPILTRTQNEKANTPKCKAQVGRGLGNLIKRLHGKIDFDFEIAL